jgi:hypothetical protein
MPELRQIDADAARGKLAFARDTGFHGAVKRRVLDHFERTGLSQRDSLRMYLKTAVLLVWFGASYALLVFAATTFLQGALLSLSLALAMAGIGFGIQHDANHGAYSSRATVNRIMGMTLDMLGASSYLWRFKHNLSHHTYTNLAGADDDINFIPFARLSPAQPRFRLHHLQQFYLWGLYWFLFPKWNFVDDFKTLMQARISGQGFPRPARLPSSSSRARRCSPAGRSRSRCCSTRGGSCCCSTAQPRSCSAPRWPWCSCSRTAWRRRTFPRPRPRRFGCRGRGRCIRLRPRSTSRAAIGC